MNVDFVTWEKVNIYSGTIFPRAKKPAYKVWAGLGNKLGIKKKSSPRD